MLTASLQVWSELFSAVSEDCRKKIVTDHLPLWFHLLGAPPGLTLDIDLFLQPPTVRTFSLSILNGIHHCYFRIISVNTYVQGAVLSIPAGVREFTVKCSLAKALGGAEKLANTQQFVSHIAGYLDSGCASHKQVILSGERRNWRYPRTALFGKTR